MAYGNARVRADASRTCVLGIALALAGALAFAELAVAQTGARAPLAPSGSRVDPVPGGNDAARAGFEDLARRVDIINRMADRFSGEAARTFGAGFNSQDWKRDFGMRWIQQSAPVLSSAASAPSLDAALDLLSHPANRVHEKALNDLRVQFLPAPCRIVDTRNAGGQLGPAYRFEYASSSSSKINSQGGNPVGCTTTPMEGALLYVTVVPPPSNTGPNFLAVQNTNTPAVPTSAAINFVNQNIANFVIVPTIFLITPPPGAATGYGFFAYASGLTHFVVDLIGYVGHSEQAYALDCTTLTSNIETFSGTNVTLANNISTFNAPACPAGYTRVATQCDIGPLLGTDEALKASAEAGCQFRTAGAYTIPAYLGASSRCCRLGPGI